MNVWTKSKKIAVAVMIALSIAMVTLIGLYAMQYAYIVDGEQSKLIAVSSDEEYAAIVKENKKIKSRQNVLEINPYVNDGKTQAPPVVEGSKDYTTTNTQQTDVDESDIVKTDGIYIYAVQAYGVVTITRASDMVVMSKVGKEVVDIYLYKSTLITISTRIAGDFTANEDALISEIQKPDTIVDITLYNIEAASNPTVLRRASIGGDYKESRLTGTRLLVAAINFSYNKLPSVESGSNIASHTAYVASTGSESYHTILYTADIITGEETSVSVSGEIGGYYVTSSKIYYFYTQLGAGGSRKSNIYGVLQDDRRRGTHVHKFDAITLQYEASEYVDGFVMDRYSFDEYNGYLRMVTTDTSGVMLSIMDANLKRVSYVDKIAPGETVYAVRFNGDEGTIVTFKQVDPVFKLNLADPLKPEVSRGLKEEGVSFYMHYLEDSKLTIGVGRDGTGEGLNNNLKISLYDNSGAEPINIKTIVIKSATSESLNNPKSFFYDAVKKQFGINVDFYIRYDSGKQFGSTYYLFDYSIEDKDFSIAHTFNQIKNSGSQYQKQRMIRIDNNYYIINSYNITKYDLEYNLIDSI